MTLKKPIKIYLQYPWKFSDSTYYKVLLEHPPEGIKYIRTIKKNGVITKKNKFLFYIKLKKIIRGILNRLNISILNIHLSPKGDYDLIHCAHCLSKDESIPWVADVEWPDMLLLSGKMTKKGKNKIKKILLRENCKRILPWTESMKYDILMYFPEVKDKIEVVFPAVALPKSRKKLHKGINLLFIGRYFYGKGGIEALKSIDILTRKHKNVRAFFVSRIPNEIKKKYSKNKKIIFYDLVPQKFLFNEIYSKSDIFIYPGYSDTFGFALLEAMSFSIPIITVDGYSRKEIIENGKNGFVVPFDFKKKKRWYPNELEREEVINGIIERTEILIKDKFLRKRMGLEGKKLIKNGKFSIKKRNKKLREIYGEIIK